MGTTGKIIAVGSADGSTTILDLCDGLCVMQQNEKQMLAQILERESRREKNLEQKAKEAKMKAKKEAMKQESNVDQAEGGDMGSLESEFFEATRESAEEIEREQRAQQALGI